MQHWITSFSVAIINDPNPPSKIPMGETLIVNSIRRTCVRRKLDHSWSALVAIKHQRLLKVFKTIVCPGNVVNVCLWSNLVLAHSTLSCRKYGSICSDSNASKNSFFCSFSSSFKLKTSFRTVCQIKRMSSCAIVFIVTAFNEEGVRYTSL